MNNYLIINDLKSAKNREDRSVLTIYSKFPEYFLTSNVAHPSEVKHLTIILDFQNNDWRGKYKDTLCSNIVNFHNLETLVAEDLNLSTDLWIEFANNSKKLKEIKLRSRSKDDNFNFHEKEAALDAIFKIPTLEKVYIEKIYLPYFPPGPSNIKYLELNYINGKEKDNFTDKERQKLKSYSTNFSTHTNIKSMKLSLSPTSLSLYSLKDLKLDKLVQLEELVLKCFLKLNIEPILKLRNLKKITFSEECINSNVEEITMYILFKKV